jgi:FAD/FMN-containing dehydrogenase
MRSDAVATLARVFSGRLLQPQDDAYDEARRIWNGMIDRHPALIARCAGIDDVRAAVHFARDQRLPVSVRSGGHNVSGSAIADGGLVIDLSELRGVSADRARSRVTAQGGARLGDLDREAQAAGLAVPVGVVSATGVAGLTLHGGLGFLTRKHGLTCDNLVAAEIVTATGEVRRADAENEPDLLWALRGGGGIGVVTSFEFRGHRVGPDVWMAVVLYPARDGPRLLRFFDRFMRVAPDELMALAIYWSAPHDEPIPKEQQGSPVLALVACWSGDVERGEDAIRPLREQGIPVADMSGRMPYLDAQRLFDPEYPDGRRYYWKSIYVPKLSEEVIDILHDSARTRPSAISSVDVWALGGAMARVNPRETAFFTRDQPYLIGIEANWIEPAEDDANITWVRDLFAELKRHSKAGAYFNFPGFLEEGDKLMRESFGANYEQLRAIQNRYDPDRLFRPNVRLGK